MRECDSKCNECPVINHPNTVTLYQTLQRLLYLYGDGVEDVVNGYCPNMTVCPACHVDDFCHVEGCELDTENTTSTCGGHLLSRNEAAGECCVATCRDCP